MPRKVTRWEAKDGSLFETELQACRHEHRDRIGCAVNAWASTEALPVPEVAALAVLIPLAQDGRLEELVSLVRKVLEEPEVAAAPPVRLPDVERAP